VSLGWRTVELEEAVARFQRAIGEAMAPWARETAYRFGRLALEAYQRMPWWRRLWVDLRDGTFRDNVADAVRWALR